MDQSTSKWHIKIFRFLSFFPFFFLLLHSLSLLKRKKNMQVKSVGINRIICSPFFYLVPALLFIHGVRVGLLQLHQIWTVNLLPHLKYTRQASLCLALPSMRICPSSWCIDPVEFLRSSTPWHCVMAPVSCSFRRVVFMYCLWNVPTTRFDGICRGNLFRGLIHEMGVLTWPAWAPAKILEQALLVSFLAFMQHIFCFCLL